MQHSLSGTSSCAQNQAQDGICVQHFFQQGRPILCSGTGLRPSEKLVRTPAPPPMDGPQRGSRKVESVTGRSTYGSHVRMICTGYWFSEQRAKAFENSCAQKRSLEPKTVQHSHSGAPSQARNRPVKAKSVLQPYAALLRNRAVLFSAWAPLLCFGSG